MGFTWCSLHLIWHGSSVWTGALAREGERGLGVRRGWGLESVSGFWPVFRLMLVHAGAHMRASASTQNMQSRAKYMPHPTPLSSVF